LAEEALVGWAVVAAAAGLAAAALVGWAVEAAPAVGW